MRITLTIRKKPCEGTTCPIPLRLIPRVEKTIKSIVYDESTEKAEIDYDEAKTSRKQIVGKLREIGYEVVE